MYAILRKSILLPKSVPIIAKRFINAEKYSFMYPTYMENPGVQKNMFNNIFIKN